MKRFGFVLVAVLLAMAIPHFASAAAITYTSGFEVQNLEDAPASIVITFYDQNGTVVAAPEDTIPANGSKTYFPLDAVPDGFSGSVVISSSTDIRAIANILGNGAAFGASYGGFTDGATTVYAPLLMKDNHGYTTWFNVQNTGLASTDVGIVYSDGTTAAYSGLQPGAAHTFDQANESHNAAVFAGTITAGEKLAVTVMEVGPTTLFAYTGFTGGSTDVAMPLINANNHGYVTGVQIQNMGGSATTVTVHYTPGLAGSPCDETQTIQAQQSATFALAAFAPGGACGNATFIGSARVANNSASQPLVAIVNQLNAAAHKGGAYEGFDPSAGTSTVVMPLIMDRNSNWWTGFSIVNVGGSQTTVNCTFTNAPSYTVSGTIDPGQALTALQNGQIKDKYVGSGTCTADRSGQIVGIVNELNSVLTGDSFLVYDAFNQ